MSQGRRAVAGRLSWGLADQAVSSLTNFAVGIYVARSLGVIAFGIFSIALVTYAFVLNVSRGLATDPLVVRFSGVATDIWRGAVARSSGTALNVGILAGVGCLLIGFGLHLIQVGGAFGKAFFGLGLVLPALMLQDSWRFAFFAAGQGRKAFLNDVVWGLALIPLLFFAAQRGSVVGSVLAWGLAAGVAAGYGCLQAGVLPRPGGVRGWLLEHRDLGPRYLLENVSLSGATQLRMYGVGAIAGLAAVGTIRGAELLLGPFLAVVMGLALVTVAEASRTLRHSPHRLRQFCMLVGGGQAAAALAWGLGLLLFLSDDIGEFILGQVWLPASTLILPVTLGVVGASLSTGAAAGLRALGAARRSLRAQLFASVLYVTAGIGGAAVNGALGSAWGVAAATLSGAVVWWYQLHSGLRERRTSLPAGPDPASTAQTNESEMRMS
jgi:O-antigen/teichoic acid export membrane protein